MLLGYTDTSNKLFPWQHDPLHQMTTGLYATHELAPHQSTSAEQLTEKL